MKKPNGSAAGGGGAPLSPYIVTHLENGSHLDLVIRQHRYAGTNGNAVHAVDFTRNQVPQVYQNNLYSLYLSSALPSKRLLNEVACIFPNARDSVAVVRSSSYTWLSSFNKAVNGALEASLHATDTTGNVKLAVCYGQHVFTCIGITGTVYIVWAEYINKTNPGRVANTIYNNVPVLLNLDGQGRFKAAFILKAVVRDATTSGDLDRLPITHNNPRILFPKDTPLFVCEAPLIPRPHADSAAAAAAANGGLTFMSRSEALAQMSLLSKPVVSGTNPFFSSVDYELDEDSVELEVSYRGGAGSDPDGGTPRPVEMYMRDVNLGQEVSRTPPIVQSEPEVDPPPDPFENKEYIV
jgi:hypothetical protein